MPEMMAVAAVGAQVAGTIMQAGAARQAGEGQKYEANYEATQLRNQSNTVAAEGEQKSQQQDLQTKYLLSDAAAKAAAGGGSVTDPSTQNVMQTIAGQGRLRSLMDIYQGQQGKQNLENQATATAYGGQLAANAGDTKQWTTIMGGASSLAGKYAPTNIGGDSASGTVPDPSGNAATYQWPPFMQQPQWQ